MIIGAKILILFIFSMLTLATAAPLTATDDEQKNILVICRIAAKSPLIGDEDTAGIAQFCVAWKAKMQAAEQKAKEELKPESESK